MMRVKKGQLGYVMILAIIIISVLTGIGLSVASVIGASYASTKKNSYADAAISVAEAGVSDTIAQLRMSDTFAGYPDTDGARKEFYNNAAQGKAEYGTVVTTNSDLTKTIVSSGYVYASGSGTAATATNKKTIEVIVSAKQIEISPSVFGGPGGVFMTSSRGPSGNVYIMGKLRLDNHATMGTAALPVNLQVGGVACMVNGNYPSQCPSNEQPVSVPYSTQINGTVCATNQTNGTGIVPASGFINPCTAQPMSMPQFDKAGYTSSMTNTRTGLSDSCGANPLPPGPTTLKDRTKYTQNLRIDFYCNTTIEGDIYVEGDFKLDYTSRMTVREGLTVPPTIVVNGAVDLGGHITANSNGVSVRIISFKSVNSVCSTSATCTVITGQELQNSINTLAINCVFCTGDGAVLWAYFGQVHLNGPRSVDAKMGAVIGNYVDISNYNYGANSWTNIPPTTVTMPSNFTVLSYRQLF